jgi:hypothetical protein
MYAPIAGLQDFDNWEVSVVNRTSSTTPVAVVVYSADGTPFSFPITLSANETRRLDIKSLLPPQLTKDTTGGISIEFSGQIMGVSGQVTISGFHGFGNIDAPIFPDIVYRSNEADSVWWEPKGSHSYLILGNSSSDVVHAQIFFDTGAHLDMDLAPHATDIQAIPEQSSKDKNINWVHVIGSGAAGTLRVTGYTASVSNGYLNTLRFYDPASSTDSAVYANGLHFSNSENHLIVKNLTMNPITVSGAIYPLAAQPSANAPAIQEKQITGGAAAEIEIPQAGDIRALDGSAIKLTSSGPRGSIVANYVSHDRQNKITRSMPFKDIGDYGISTGGYPWRIDGNHDSRIFITNVGKVRAAIGATIRPENDSEYFIDTRYLEVGETAIFDIRKIRDERIPDSKGATLPKTASLGQFDWTTIFGDGSQRLIGRNEISDNSSGLSASFSCGGICNCPYSTLSGFITPTAPFVVVNGNTNIIATGTSTDSCGGGVPSNFTITPSSWTINTPSYFNLSAGHPTSTMTGTSTGTSSFYTPFIGTYYVWNGQTGQCLLNGNPPINPGGTGGTIGLTCSPSPVVRGSNATCSVSNAPSGATFSGWKFTDSNNHSVTSGNATGSWSGPMVTTGTVSVSVSANGKTTPVSVSITVTNRTWHTTPASPASVPNGTFSVLPVPPQPTGSDSGLGISLERTGNSGFASTFVSQDGPNKGYGYYATPPTFTPLLYQYELNPDLVNSASTFSQHQCGNYNASSNPSGFISWPNLSTQTSRHEYNSTVQSHYAFYSNSISGANNPGDYVERQVAAPGTSASTFDAATATGLNTLYSNILANFSVQPFAVNESETGVFLGKINYAPYTACN